MKLFLILSCLCGLLQANIVDVVEGEATYRQTVTIDYDKNIQIVEVPAHNHIIHSKTIFDFNNGKQFESHPEKKTCFVSDIPEGTSDLKTFDEYLQRKTVKLIASKEKRAQKAFENSRKWNVKMLKSMASEVIEECGESQMYEVVEVPMDTARKTLVKPTKKGSAYEKMMKSGEGICENIEECIWQSCTYRQGSCSWIVNWYPGGCDTYNSAVIHNADDHLQCTGCFNIYCGPQCVAAWNDKPCHDALVNAHFPKCPENPTYGGHCEDLNKPYCLLPDVYYPEAAEKGRFECPTATEKGIVPLGGDCYYFCNNEMYGGMVVCDEKEVNGKMEGYFDESGYYPEFC